ncbi:protein kinase domain-containing protein [Streptomyces sp. OZ13]|uniref:serine/threonine-protein kinase n=1 Tax=Streptomyces sp. OZ13 TaxID=3452210 RepID=UPI003F8923D8
MKPHEALAGRYRLIKVIGSGGFGSVWKAFDERMQRHVAIKVLTHSGVGLDSEKAAARFWQEAITAGGLSNDHIVTVHDFDRTDHNGSSRDFLVMELLTGRPLSQMIAAGPPPVRQALDWAGQICASLQAAHDAGVIHRDIKPQNIIVAEDGNRLKVVDFGIAKSAALPLNLTVTGEVIGSVMYMAPERAAMRAVDARSDLYSLGCVLYELLTGHPPFYAPDSPPVAVVHCHIHTPPSAPSSRRPGLPDGIDRLVLDLLAKDPEDRPEGAAVVRARIGELIREIDHSEDPPRERETTAQERDLARRVEHAVEIGNRGQASRARNLLRGAVSDCAHALGAGSRSTLTARLHLAHCTTEAGWLSQGRDLADKLANDCDRMLGAEDSLTLRARSLHGRTVKEFGRPDKARALLSAVVDDCVRHLGPQSVDTLEARLHHADATHSCDDHAEAQRLAAELAGDCDLALGARHVITLRARILHAWTSSDMGETDSARDLYAAVLSDCISYLGPDAPDTIVCRIAQAVHALADNTISLASNRDQLGLLLTDCQRVFGMDGAWTYPVRLLLAATIRHIEGPDENFEQLNSVLIDVASTFGTDSPAALVARYSAAGLLEATENTTQARALLQQVLPDCVRVLGADAPISLDIQDTLNRLS